MESIEILSAEVPGTERVLTREADCFVAVLVRCFGRDAGDLASVRYEITQDGRILLEAKDECRRRLGRSPDRADALMLAIGAGGFGLSLAWVEEMFTPWEEEADVAA
jgi:hypothetical protein